MQSAFAMAINKKDFSDWLAESGRIPASEAYPAMVESLERRYACDLSKMSFLEINTLDKRAIVDMESARVNKHLDPKGFNTNYETPLSALRAYNEYMKEADKKNLKS